LLGRAEPILIAGGRAVQDYREAFVGIDAAKARNAIAVAEGGRNGEVRYFGEVDASAENMRRIVKRIADKYDRVHFCYEAGPTGYGLHRLVISLGHECTVVAPSLIPRKPGDRVKTNRRDALTLAKLLRAGELTAVLRKSTGAVATSTRTAPVGPITRCPSKRAAPLPLSSARHRGRSGSLRHRSPP
jgi:hypothetical protein